MNSQVLHVNCRHLTLEGVLSIAVGVHMGVYETTAVRGSLPAGDYVLWSHTRKPLKRIMSQRTFTAAE